MGAAPLPNPDPGFRPLPRQARQKANEDEKGRRAKVMAGWQAHKQANLEAALRAQKKQLKPAQGAFADPSGHVPEDGQRPAQPPDPAMVIKRGQEPGHEFADRVVRVRAAVNELASEPAPNPEEGETGPKEPAFGPEFVSRIQIQAGELAQRRAKEEARRMEGPGYVHGPLRPPPRTAKEWDEQAERTRLVNIVAPPKNAKAKDRFKARPEDAEGRYAGKPGSGGRSTITFDDVVHNVVSDRGEKDKTALASKDIESLPPSVKIAHELGHALDHGAGKAIIPSGHDPAGVGDVKYLQNEFENQKAENAARAHVNRLHEGSKLLKPIKPRKDYSGENPESQAKLIGSLDADKQGETWHAIWPVKEDS
jgi:hypothetical protein